MNSFPIPSNMHLLKTRKGKFESGFAEKNREENDEIHESLFSLTISDNGKGIPENMELKSLSHLDCKLVSILVDQLDGKIEIKRSTGDGIQNYFQCSGG